jgi:hypothetical protein
MEKLYKKFFVNSYLQTNGFVPIIPSLNQVLPGDFFQIRKGEIKILGNIFRDKIIDPRDVTIEYDIHHSADRWNMSEGVKKPYFGNRDLNKGLLEEEKDIKAFQFESPGSFFFNCEDPRSVKIKNWSHIEDQLTIKLTQILYSFREIYVVSESAYLEQWLFALANDFHAELELIVRLRENGSSDFFRHSESKAVLAKNIECYLRGTEKGLPFFKAKKLSTRDERNRLASIDAIRNENAIIGWANDFFTFDFRVEDDHRNARYSEISIIDKLRANELNPTTTLEFFHWTDFNLDDIEQLFLGYD